MSNKKPLSERLLVVRITARPAAPVILASDLHLDGLIAAVHPALHGAGHPVRGDTMPHRRPPLPLYRAFAPESPHDWVWTASAATFSDDAEEVLLGMTKRRDGVDIAAMNRQVSPGIGSMRDRLMRPRAVVCREITFHAATFDLPDLRRLLRRVTHLGGWRKAGCGELIGDWTVEPVAYPWQAVLQEADGKANRLVPASFLQTGAEKAVKRQTRPPYFCHTEESHAVAPGDSITLREDLQCA